LDARLARIAFYAAVLLIGAPSIRTLFSLTVSDWLFLASLGILLLLNFDRIRWDLPAGLTIGVGIFTLGALISTAGSRQPGESLGELLRFVYLTVIWFWLGTMILDTPSRLQTAMFLWILSAAADGGLGLLQVIWGPAAIAYTADSSVTGRVQGLTQFVNDLGGIAATTLVPAALLASVPKLRLRFRIPLQLLLVLDVGGLLVSGSVAGFLAVVMGLLLWLRWSRIGGRRLLSLVWVIAIVPGVIALQVALGRATPGERLAQVTTPLVGTLFDRIALVQSAWQVITDNPVIGVGLGGANVVVPTGAYVHNMLLGAWIGAGILGFVGLCVVEGSILASGLTAVRAARTVTEANIVIALLISLFAAFVMSMSGPYLNQRWIWLPAALILAVRAQQIRSTATKALLTTQSQFASFGTGNRR
jgi:O-antigen ligase